MVLKFIHFYFSYFRSKPSPIIPNEVVDEQEIIEVREAKPMDELCAAEEREGKGIATFLPFSSCRRGKREKGSYVPIL